MYKVFHRTLGHHRFERLYVVCDQIGQAETRVHQSRDENSTPDEAEPGPYTGPGPRSADDPQFL